MKLRISSSEDLWQLYNLIACGDSITTKSKRKVTKENAVSSLGSTVKILVLEVEVKDMFFSPDEIHIGGVNRTESDFVRLGAHHSLRVVYDPPQELLLKKEEWNEVLEERLRYACNSDEQSDTMALLVDYGMAQLVTINPSLFSIKATVHTTIPKKRRTDASARDKGVQQFFKKVKETLLLWVKQLEKSKLIIVGSPGTVREELLKYLKANVSYEAEKERALAQCLSKFALVKVSNLSHDGVRQVMEDPATAMMFQDKRCQKDMQEWGRFQSLLSSQPDRCVYTPQVVYAAVQLEAVSSLMISDAVFRSPDPVVRYFFLALAQAVKRGGGTSVHIFSSNHVSGEQLTMLGEVAAILSFDCPELDEVEPCEEFFESPEVADFIKGVKVIQV